MIFSKTAKTVTISGRYDLGLPIVEQFVVMTVVGESRDQAEDRRDDEKEKASMMERIATIICMYDRITLRTKHLDEPGASSEVVEGLKSNKFRQRLSWTQHLIADDFVQHVDNLTQFL